MLGFPMSLLSIVTVCLSVPLLLVWRRYGETHSRYWAWSALWVAQMGLGHVLEAEWGHPMAAAYSIVATLGAGWTLYLGTRLFVGRPLPDRRHRRWLWALFLVSGLVVGVAAGRYGLVRAFPMLASQLCLIRSLGWLWAVARREGFGGAYLATIGMGALVVLNVAYPFSFHVPLVNDWGYAIGGILLLVKFIGLLMLTVERLQAQWRYRASDLIDELAQRSQSLMETGQPAAIGQTASLVALEVERRLTALDADLSSITGQLPSESKLHQTGDRIRQAVDTSSRLIAEILDGRDDAVIEWEPVDLQALLTTVLATVKGGDVQVREIWPASPVWVLSEPRRLAQVVVNLVQNAVDAMPDGGLLTVEVEAGRDEVRVQVRDTGGGMTAAILERIFDPYYTTKPTGTGLGMAIVRSLLDSIGGDIALASEPGCGSQITVTLPAAQPHDQEAPTGREGSRE